MSDQGARVIELFGPAGVGKSSILQLLINRRRATGIKWQTVAEALRVPRNLPVARQVAQLVFPFIDRSELLQRVLYRAPISAEKKDALICMAANWSEFIETCLASVAADKRSPEVRLLTAFAVAEALQVRALLASDRQNGNLVLADEPLSHKSFKVFSEDDKAAVREREFFETMPLPAGLIHFVASANSIVERLYKRQDRTGKLIRRHRNLDHLNILSNTQWAIDLGMKGAMILMNRGVPILSLDAEKPPHENIEEIESFIQLEKNRGASFDEV